MGSIKKRLFTLGLAMLFLLFWGCQKSAGPGGKASIKGKVYVKDYNNGVTTLLAEYYGAGENVYISYGDNTSANENVKTGADGSFEFAYLRPGHYTVFVMTRDTTIKYSGADAEIPIKLSVDIAGKKDTKDLGTINICK